MRGKVLIGLMACLFVLLSVPQANAANGHRYGLGVFVDRTVPVLGFGDRYRPMQKYGLTLDYKLSDRTTLEFEYHHASSNDGKIESRAFYWPIDKQWHYSPQANSTFNLNSFLINAMARLGEITAGDVELIPYVAVGGGIYDYQNKVSGMVYPGQNVEPLDTELLLLPEQDDHTPLGANLGVGATVRQGRFALDVRARCHLIMGDMRSMEAWGIANTFPISMVDLRTTFKFFW